MHLLRRFRKKKNEKGAPRRRILVSSTLGEGQHLLASGPPVRNFDWGGQTFSAGDITCHKYSLFSYFLVKYVYYHCELNYNSSNSQEIAGFPLHYSSGSVKTTFFNRYEDTVWPPQCHNFDSTAGAGGFTAGAAAPAVNMLEEALPRFSGEILRFILRCRMDLYNLQRVLKCDQEDPYMFRPNL